MTIESVNWILLFESLFGEKEIQPNGDWRGFLPVYEPQFGGNWDTDGCSIWGSLNGYETLLKRMTGKEFNFSERAVYIGTKTRPPGANAIKINEWICANGLIDNLFLPMTSTFEEFIQPDPLPEHLRDLGKEFLKRYKLSFRQKSYLSPEKQRSYITKNLKFSPLGIAVAAWRQDENGLYYRAPGMKTNHFCLLVAEDVGFDWVFDSYDHSLKKVRSDMGYSLIIRFRAVDNFAFDYV